MLAVTLADGLQMSWLCSCFEKIVLAGHAGEAAIADAEDLDRDLRRVDGDDGNALLAAARQHVGAAGDAHGRLAVAHIGGDLDLP